MDDVYTQTMAKIAAADRRLDRVLELIEDVAADKRKEAARCGLISRFSANSEKTRFISRQRACIMHHWLAILIRGDLSAAADVTTRSDRGSMRFAGTRSRR